MNRHSNEWTATNTPLTHSFFIRFPTVKKKRAKLAHAFSNLQAAGKRNGGNAVVKGDRKTTMTTTTTTL